MHHVKPRYLFPALVYDRTNLITLCKWHHEHLAHGGDWCAWVPKIRDRAEECRVLGWTSPEMLVRVHKERAYTVEGAAAPGGGRIEPVHTFQVPKGGATPGWWARVSAAVLGRLGVVLVLLVPLGLVGCKANSPGVRVSVGFLGADVTIQIGGADLAPRVSAESVPSSSSGKGPEDKEEPR